MKEMFNPFINLRISTIPNGNNTEYILKEKKGTPKKFSISFENNLLESDKIVVINAEKFLGEASLRGVAASTYNSKTIDFAIIDFRNINNLNNEEIIIYLIEMGGHSPHELKLKFNSSFSILIAYISKYLQLTNLNPNDSFSFKCNYKLIHVIEHESKQLMLSDEDMIKQIYKHDEYEFNVIEVDQINYSCKFDKLEYLHSLYLVFESLPMK